MINAEYQIKNKGIFKIGNSLLFGVLILSRFHIFLKFNETGSLGSCFLELEVCA